ncbi:MAG TPA: hypothetical protein VMC86_03825 [Gemmatimonadales bacterium]|nr:hypothetical protein [Gemmatimonadales bacterium]
MRTLARAALLLTLALGGCRELGQLMSLQQGLVKRYQTPGINVNITNDVMSVLFTNSKYAGLPESDRRAFARDVAGYVRDHFAGYPSLGTIRVGFNTMEPGVVTTSHTEIPYVFTRGELGGAQDASKEPPPPVPGRVAVDS